MAIFLISMCLSIVWVVFSQMPLTPNRLTAVTFQAGAAQADLKTVVFEEAAFGGSPVVWKTDCSADGNVKWDRNNPILESDPPSGSLNCTFFPTVIGSKYGDRLEITIRRQPQGGEAILKINNAETRVSALSKENEAEVEQVALSIPWTPGIAAAKLVELLDYLLVFFCLFVLLPFLLTLRVSDAIAHRLRKHTWRSIFTVTYICVFVYILLEWLFIITKPSFLSAVTFPQKSEALLAAAALFSILVFLPLALLLFLNLITGLQNKTVVYIRIAQGVPAVVASALIFLLIDNFTYTILSWGIDTSHSYQKVFYILLLALLFVTMYPVLGNILAWLDVRLERTRLKKYLLPFILAVIVVTMGLVIQRQNPTGLSGYSVDENGQKDYPDIILITGDGINATQTSLFDPQRGTTPHIRTLAETSLVAENAFTNAGNTAGSIISIYTDKYPTETRLLYPPDILRGIDSYQHLPGILKSIGYYNVEFAAPHNADAFDLNLISGFDIANGRSIQNDLVFSVLNEFLQSNDAYLVYQIYTRLWDRLKHIFFIADMNNDQALVKGLAQVFDDQAKIDGLLDILQKADRPVFAHVHWMGTHAGKYTPEEEADETVNDEKIAEFDASVGKFVEALTRDGRFDNTLLIVGSDHGRMYFTTKRIPLLFHFPGDEHAGRLKSDVQNMDIAPTILDYLGIPRPVWMRGDSLLEGEPGNRVIFAAGVPGEIRETGFVAKEYMKPPFYQFGYISVVYCNYWYRYSFEDYGFASGKVTGHTNPCPAAERPSGQQVLDWMKEHLRENHFDVSTMKLNVN